MPAGEDAPPRLRDALLSTDHRLLLESLARDTDFLLLQDLDGVCMGLVSDPLTRTLEADYIHAARALGSRFRVLTNGEHTGRRGVNRIVEAALGDPAQAAREGLYLPGLAAGGVQLQDAHGTLSHPGVHERELAFLASVPEAARQALDPCLAVPPFKLAEPEREALLGQCVLDNAVSPTINLNPLYHRFADRPQVVRIAQECAEIFMLSELERAASLGLGDAFFLHLAPNAGSDARGERLRLCDGRTAGTTDFQLMLSGAVKEVGVLVLLNQHIAARSGQFPLGADFNARSAPRGRKELLQLARDAIAPGMMPRLVGVGDTVSSHYDRRAGAWRRGGSDRGFLTLVQELGRSFGTDNATVLVDSSAGEVKRPGVQAERLHTAEGIDWGALKGISDPADPLRLNFLFPDGHRQYTRFFCALAARRREAEAGAQSTPAPST